jgi:hypothetical protein
MVAQAIAHATATNARAVTSATVVAGRRSHLVLMYRHLVLQRLEQVVQRCEVVQEEHEHEAS